MTTNDAMHFAKLLSEAPIHESDYPQLVAYFAEIFEKKFSIHKSSEISHVYDKKFNKTRFVEIALGVDTKGAKNG